MINDLADLSSTYFAAKQYSINDLCSDLLNLADEELKIFTSTVIYDQYLKLGDLVSNRLEEVVGIINLHAFLAFLDKNFTKISLETLIKLLESDQLFIREKDVYYACMAWMQAELERQGKGLMNCPLHCF